MVCLYELTYQARLYVLSDISPWVFPLESLLDGAHSPMHTHMSNEENIMVLFHNILPEGLWNEHLFMTILHTMQYPLRGMLESCRLSSSLECANIFWIFGSTNWALRNCRTWYLDNERLDTWIKLKSYCSWSWLDVKSSSTTLGCLILGCLGSWCTAMAIAYPKSPSHMIAYLL